MSRPNAIAVLVGSLVTGLPAQCPFQNVATQVHGSACNEAFGFNPTLRVELDVGNCRLDLTVDAYSGCCNTFMQSTILMIGPQQANVPLPFLPPPCTLLVQPTHLLVDLGSTAGTHSIPIPPNLPALSFFAQGAATYFHTLSFPRVAPPLVALTTGYLVALQ